MIASNALEYKQENEMAACLKICLNIFY